MIIVVIFSKHIVLYINAWRDYYNTLDELGDFARLFRVLLNYWEGISIAFNLAFLFLIRKLITTFSGAINKITN